MQPEVIQPPEPVTCTTNSSQDQMMQPEPTELDQLQQNPNLTTIGQDEEFVPGTTCKQSVLFMLLFCFV